MVNLVRHMSSWATQPAFGLGINQSVFTLTAHQIAELTHQRLYAQYTDRGKWGCASTRGFRARGASLTEVVRRDAKVLEKHGVDYNTVGSRMMTITSAAMGILGTPSWGIPVRVEDGKFEVTLTENRPTHQFCPFSPEDDMDASPWKAYNHACPSSNSQWRIRNTKTNQQIDYEGLSPHLIAVHHFFPKGSGANFLNPIDVIETLELSPPKKPDLQSSKGEKPDLVFPKLPLDAVSTWMVAGHQEVHPENLQQIITTHRGQLQEVTEGLWRIDLSYDSGSSLIHLFNTTPDMISVHQVIDGALLDVSIPPNCLLILEKKNKTAEVTL